MSCRATARSTLDADITGHRPAREIVELLVAQQDLDHADVDLALQQVGGEGVVQRVCGDALGEVPVSTCCS